MPEFRYGNAAVHCGDNGNGAPLLLLHSGGSSGAPWHKAGVKLTARRLLTPDFCGYGTTDGWDSDEQPIDTPDGDSYARYDANMLPVDYKSSSPVSPLFAYPYARAW